MDFRLPILRTVGFLVIFLLAVSGPSGSERPAANLQVSGTALVFPQFVNGELNGHLNRTRIILRNPSEFDDSGVVLFRGPGGAAANVPFSGAGRDSVDYSLGPWSTLELETDGTGSLQQGTIEVRSSRGSESVLEGTLIFEVLGNSVSVNNASAASRRELYVSRTADENTGFAAFNPDAAAVTIEVRLRDDHGELKATRQLDLQPLEQLTGFVDEARLFADYFKQNSAEFKGTIAIEVLSGSGLSAVGLIQKRQTGALIAVAGSTGQGSSQLVFPQFVNGEVNGQLNRTRIILRNTSDQIDLGTIEFLTLGAYPIPVGGTPVKTLQYSVQPHGTFEVETDGTGKLVSGYVRVTSSGPAGFPLTGTVVYSVLGAYVSVDSSPPLRRHQVYVSRKDKENTGVALFYQGQLTLAAELVLLDRKGQPVAQRSVELTKDRGLSAFIDETALFSSYFSKNKQDFEGTLNIVALGGRRFSAVGLLQRRDSGSLIAVSTGEKAYGKEPVAPALPLYPGQTFPIGVLADDELEGTAAVADLDRDSDLDLLVADRNSGVAVLLGNGNGTFQKPMLFPAAGARLVSVGEFDGDGIPDLATIGGNVGILFGYGDGTFREPKFLAAGNGPAAIAVADLNLDGRSDIVVANTNSNNLSVILGNGDGTFQPTRFVESGSKPTAVAVANINSDSIPDIAVGSDYQANFSVVLGNGDGTYRPGISGPGSIHTVYQTGIRLADLDGKNGPDLVGTGYAGTIVHLGRGDGTFGSPAIVGVPNASPSSYFNESPNPVQIADLDGDGKLDMVAGGSFFLGSVLRGKGDGSFETPWVFPSARSTIFLLGDFDGDHQLDLLTVNSENQTASILRGNGDGTFETSEHFSALPPSANKIYPSDVALGDFNQDGLSDLVSQDNTSKSIALVLGDGKGSFGQRLSFPAAEGPVSAGDSMESIAVGDVNGDGFGDVVVTDDYFGRLVTLLGKGNASFQPPRFSSVEVRPSSLSLEDLNGDGHLDAITAHILFAGVGENSAAGSVKISWGKGDGTFGVGSSYFVGGMEGKVIGSPIPAFPRKLALADLNGDNRKDIVVATSVGVSVLLGSGGGNFQTPVQYRLNWYGSPESAVAVADVDGDSILDIVAAGKIYVGTFPQGGVTILSGRGDGTFEQAWTSTAFGSSFNSFKSIPTAVVVADLDFDGLLDIATANYQSDVAVLLGKSGGTFSDPFYFAAGSPYSLAAGDVNRDGKPDLVTANGNSIGRILLHK